MKKKNGLFYGWVILIYCMILSACGTGILSYLNAVFVEPVTASLGVSRASYMLYSTFSTVTTMIFMPVAGVLYRKYAVKPLVILGALCGAGAMLVYSLARHVYGFYAGGILAGLSVCLCGALPMTMVLNNWFVEKRGLVTGIAFMGSAIASAVLSPVISSMIVSSGYQTGYRFLSVLFLVLLVPTTLLVLKVKPADKGLVPYGSQEQDKGQAAEKTGFPAAQVFRSPAFYLVCTAAFLLGLVTFGTQSQLVAYWVSIGIREDQASGVYSLVMVASAAAKMLLGGVYDRWGIAKGSAVFFSAGILALVCLVIFTEGWLIIIPAVLFGMMTALQVLLTSYVVSRLFGEKCYSAVFGVLNTVLFCGVSVGVPLSALLYDLTSSYRTGWLVFAGFMAVAMAAILTADCLSRKMFRTRLGIQRGA